MHYLIFLKGKEYNNLEILKQEELKNVKGGGITFKFIMGLITAGTFIVGLVDGFLRPLKCRNY